MSQVFILGASDPEMEEIVSLLRERGEKFYFATSDGRRVHPGNAYKADPVNFDDDEIILVECEPEEILSPVKARIDHHRPGDPGYGLPASEFWQASSLGQFCKFLGIEPSHDQAVLAAMDHAPAAAIRGECPGVSAHQVLDRKIKEIAKWTNHDAWEVRDKVGYYHSRLMNAPLIQIGQSVVSDLRSEYLGEGYSVNLLAAQVAALAGGYTVLLRHRDKEGDSEKWSIAGHATPECIQVFKDTWAPAQRLTNIYGVPSRGYAGGYLPE